MREASEVANVTTTASGAADPSGWHERVVLAAIAFVGLAISAYLAAYQLGLLAAPWDPIFGASSSSRVLHSEIARSLPIPDAALGVIAYAIEITVGLAGGRDRWRRRPWLVVAFAVVAVGLGLVGLGLTAVQAFVVRSGCTLCLCSAAASIAVAAAVVTGEELRAALHTMFPRTERRQP
jgi:uncharacterized membrane protein